MSNEIAIVDCCRPLDGTPKWQFYIEYEKLSIEPQDEISFETKAKALEAAVKVCALLHIPDTIEVVYHE